MTTTNEDHAMRILREALELVVAHNRLVPSCTPVCPLVVDLAREALAKAEAVARSDPRYLDATQ